MYSNALWLLTLGLQCLLIAVAVYRKFFRRYLGFYVFLCAGVLISAARFYVRTTHREAYLGFFFWTEFVLVAMGFCVTFSIFREVLRHYAGVRSMANFLVTGTFMIVAGQAIVQATAGDLREAIGGVLRFQRHMQFLEIALLALLTMLILYYAIPLGRNIVGLLSGYGFYLVSSAIMITVRGFVTPSAQGSVEVIRQFAGVLAAVIWLCMLW